MPNTFSTDINVLGPRRVVLSGTSEGQNGVANVEIIGSDVDLGSAHVAANGDWRFTAVVPKNNEGIGGLKAIVTDGIGGKTTIEADFSVIPDHPKVGNLEQIITSKDSASANVFSSDGKLLYDAEVVSEAFSVTGHGANVPFFIFNGVPSDITNFHISGSGHDTLDFSETQFSHLGQVLRHTSTFQGNSTIHLDENVSVKLEGVTKSQLAHHPNVFSFG